jgi:hypothetical protein
MRNMGFSGKWVWGDFWRLMQLEWSRLLLEVEEEVGIQEKMACEFIIHHGVRN